MCVVCCIKQSIAWRALAWTERTAPRPGGVEWSPGSDPSRAVDRPLCIRAHSILFLLLLLGSTPAAKSARLAGTTLDRFGTLFLPRSHTNPPRSPPFSRSYTQTPRTTAAPAPAPTRSSRDTPHTQDPHRTASSGYPTSRPRFGTPVKSERRS